jgi:hypothetical protein
MLAVQAEAATVSANAPSLRYRSVIGLLLVDTKEICLFLPSPDVQIPYIHPSAM